MQREMKRLISIFIVCMCTLVDSSWGAVNIKKAAPVATKKTEAVESATSLLPTVIGLVSSVQALNAQKQQLSADCAPTYDEINTVNELVKEWAKLGETTSSGAASGLGYVCEDGYQKNLDLGEDACYDTFHSSVDEGTVWDGFPKVSTGKKCKDDNNKNCTTVSNIYDIFAKIPFSDGEYAQSDYTKSEIKKVAGIREKAQRCSTTRLAAAKRELVGGFLTQTLSSVGQSTGATGTASILEAVSSMGGSGDFKSMLPSLGQMATQVLDK